MAGSAQGGTGQLGRLAIGVLLAALVATIVYLAAGGAGPDGQAAGVLLAVVAATIGVGTLLIVTSRRARSVGAAGPAASPGPSRGGRSAGSRAPSRWGRPAGPTGTVPMRAPDASRASWAPGSSAGWSPGSAPPAAPNPGSLWAPDAAPAARPRSRSGSLTRPASGTGTRRSLLSGHRPWVVVGLGVTAFALSVVGLAVGAGAEPSDEELPSVVAGVVLLIAAPCLIAGMIAAWRGRGQLATWIELGAGMALGGLGFGLLAAAGGDAEGAVFAAVALLMLDGLIGTVAFLVGWFLWIIAAARRIESTVRHPRG